MPSPPPSHQQPVPQRNLRRRSVLWGLFAAFAVIAAVFLYLRTRPPAAEPSPAATPATSASAVAARPATPVIVPRHIYSETAKPANDIAAALALARSQHKRVILDFGGDWCGDCQVLDIYFHQPPNAALLDQNFVLVHVWIGQMDRNIDLAAKYGVPIAKGVPALAVLAPDGRVLYAQQTGQFNDMRHMEASSVTEFLTKWKT